MRPIAHLFRHPVSIRPFFATGVLLAFAVAGLVGYYVNEVRVARDDTPRIVAEAWQHYGKYLTLHDLSDQRLRWLLAVEDPAFFDHRGVDLDTPGAGMTTISQGLVKLLYFPNGFHKGLAKFRQTLIAQYAFDAVVPKDEQIELLLNIAYMGDLNGSAIHGFSGAARVYFHKDFSSLSDEEFKSLVAMLPAPNRFIPGSPAFAERMKRIEAYLSGAYHPMCVLDVEYDGKTRGTFGEEALMMTLRLITDAKPQPHSVAEHSNAQPVIPPVFAHKAAQGR